MTGKNNMTLILTASLAAFSTVLYNVFQKMTPANVNPALALTITYTVGLGITLVMFVFFPTGSLLISFQKLNWVSYALGFAIAGVEIATLLAYRAGWELSLLGIMVNVLASLFLVILGAVFFKERLTIINYVGILVCIVGFVMINIKR